MTRVGCVKDVLCAVLKRRPVVDSVSRRLVVCCQNKRWTHTSPVHLDSADRSSRQFQSKSPYKGEERQLRDQYKKERWDGGILPRPDEMKDVPVKGLPPYDPATKDQWTKEKALFGQNDYIDILGDGTVHPADLMQGPLWLRKRRGNEYRRILMQFGHEDEYLREMEPSHYHMMEKNARYLHKHINRRIAGKGQNTKPRRKARTDRFNTSKNFLY